MTKEHDNDEVGNDRHEGENSTRRGLLKMLGALGLGAVATGSAACDEGEHALATSASALTANAQVSTCKTMAELRSLRGSKEQVAVLFGFAAPGDGGGGVFYWDATLTTEDLGTQILPTGSTRGGWRRLFEGEYNARWFGCLPSVSDCSDALQAAIAAASGSGRDPAGTTFASRSGVVYLPSGTYRIQKTISYLGSRTAYPKFKLRGDGALFEGGTVLQMGPLLSGGAIAVPNRSAPIAAIDSPVTAMMLIVGAVGFELEGIEFDAQHQVDTCVWLLEWRPWFDTQAGCDRCLFSRCAFMGAGVPLSGLRTACFTVGAGFNAQCDNSVWNECFFGTALSESEAGLTFAGWRTIGNANTCTFSLTHCGFSGVAVGVDWSYASKDLQLDHCHFGEMVPSANSPIFPAICVVVGGDGTATINGGYVESYSHPLNRVGTVLLASGYITAGAAPNHATSLLATIGQAQAWYNTSVTVVGMSVNLETPYGSPDEGFVICYNGKLTLLGNLFHCNRGVPTSSNHTNLNSRIFALISCISIGNTYVNVPLSAPYAPICDLSGAPAIGPGSGAHGLQALSAISMGDTTISAVGSGAARLMPWTGVEFINSNYQKNVVLSWPAGASLLASGSSASTSYTWPAVFDGSGPLGRTPSPGDMVTVSSTSIDAGVLLFAQITAPGVLTLTVLNTAASAFDLARLSGTTSFAVTFGPARF